MSKIENIVGRMEETTILKAILKSNKPEFVAVYGRRRVGKTFLIQEVYKKNMIFEFTGAKGFEAEAQLNNFYKELVRQTKTTKYIEPPINWLEAFYLLANFAKKQNKKRKKSIIFIDELPWLDTPKSNFVSALEYFWNSQLSKLNNIALVICGSATSWINQKIFKNVGGLHNRVTQRLQLKPFSLIETAIFCKQKNINFNHYQIAQLYMAMGGIPFYLEQLKRGKSVVQQINDLCFKANGLLNKEFDNLYPALFKNAAVHIKLIKVLASKPQGLTQKEITTYAKLKIGGNIVKALTELEECGFISYHNPVFNQKRNGIYRLIDFYSLFYLKFIEKANKGGQQDFNKLFKTQAYKIWCGYAYENLCWLHLDEIKKALGISGIYSNVSSWKFMGNQYYDGTQIDLVIDRDDGLINLCEVKFFNAEFTVTKTYAQQLRKRKAIFEANNKSKKAVTNILISTYGVVRNEWFFEQIDREVVLEDLF